MFDDLKCEVIEGKVKTVQEKKFFSLRVAIISIYNNQTVE